mmetsp:Transcript_20967/g.30711  ORF Transcript_20967/g.30711 Transcript_20967/m.30711 type:complete len:176 (-) Transcript_20967:152-679(-)
MNLLALPTTTEGKMLVNFVSTLPLFGGLALLNIVGSGLPGIWPDVRFGFTPDELYKIFHDWSKDERSQYVRVNTCDFVACMPGYTASIGFWLYLSGRRAKLESPVRLCAVILAAWAADVVETIVLRKGCLAYPSTMGDGVILIGSIAQRMKWLCLLSSVVVIVFLNAKASKAKLV